MNKLSVSGKLEYEDLIILTNELKESLGLRVDEKSLKKYKRKEAVIMLAIFVPIFSLVIWGYSDLVFNIIEMLSSMFIEGDYMKGFGFIAVTLLILYLLFFKLDTRSKIQKEEEIGKFFFEDDEIVIFIEGVREAVSWSMIQQLKILNSGILFEVKGTEMSSYFGIPNRFFKDKTQKEEIITFCNLKIRRS